MLEASDPRFHFGAYDFCATCQVCTRACPPGAIASQKQMVRGVERWYVDFDRCIPYFAETVSCGICIAECPWSRPDVRPKLLATMARRFGLPLQDGEPDQSVREIDAQTVTRQAAQHA